MPDPVSVVKAILLYALECLRPEPVLKVSEWAAEHRVLDGKTSAEPGRWSNARTPYLIEIMDSLSSSHPCEAVVFQKGAQIGGTEVGNNWLGYVIDHSPGPIMCVQPTIDLGKRYSRQRLQPMFDLTPSLAGKIAEARERDASNTMTLKDFDGGMLVVSGANSGASLRSMPMRRIFFDEVDAYPFDVDGEGDPIDLATQRTATFANRKIYACSTPLIKDSSRIEALYESSDKRRFWVPCPRDLCGAFQVLEWGRVEWPTGEPSKARYKCKHCDGMIDNREKSWMLARGEWRAEVETDGKIRGYHLSSLYSPPGWLSWGDLAVQFVRAARNPDKLKVFVNTKLAQTWDTAAGERMDPSVLCNKDRLEAFGVGCPVEGAPEVPDGVVVLTAGVDVQADRLECEVVGWGRGQESWSVGMFILHGDPTGPDVWRDLSDLLARDFGPRPTTGEFLQISATCIDTGYEAARVYDYVRDKRRVWAVKGDDNTEKPKNRPIWPHKPSRNNKGKIDLWMVGVDTAKDAIYGRLRLTERGDGFCHFPIGRARDWFDQLTVEVKEVTFVRGFRRHRWKKPDGARNEALDCRVYALAALHGWMSLGYRLDRRVDSAAPKPQDSGEKRGGWLARAQTGSWLSRDGGNKGDGRGRGFLRR